MQGRKKDLEHGPARDIIKSIANGQPFLASHDASENDPDAALLQMSAELSA